MPQSNSRSTAQTGGLPGLEGNSSGLTMTSLYSLSIELAVHKSAHW